MAQNPRGKFIKNILYEKEAGYKAFYIQGDFPKSLCGVVPLAWFKSILTLSKTTTRHGRGSSRSLTTYTKHYSTLRFNT